MGHRQLAAYRKKFTYAVDSLPTRSGLEVPLTNAGAPTNNVTALGQAQVGSQLIDVQNGIHYICTATNGTSTITWTKTGTQV